MLHGSYGSGRVIYVKSEREGVGARWIAFVLHENWHARCNEID